jgi:hypothetical protein
MYILWSKFKVKKTAVSTIFMSRSMTNHIFTVLHLCSPGGQGAYLSLWDPPTPSPCLGTTPTGRWHTKQFLQCASRSLAQEERNLCVQPQHDTEPSSFLYVAWASYTPLLATRRPKFKSPSGFGVNYFNLTYSTVPLTAIMITDLIILKF